MMARRTILNFGAAVAHAGTGGLYQARRSIMKISRKDDSRHYIRRHDAIEERRKCTNAPPQLIGISSAYHHCLMILFHALLLDYCRRALYAKRAMTTFDVRWSAVSRH